MSETTDRLMADLRTKTLEEVAAVAASADAAHYLHRGGMIEFTRRQTEWQINGSQAQIEAAGAEKEAAKAATAAATAEAEAAKAAAITADATLLSATHIRRSVMVAVASSVFACVAALASSVQSYVSWQGRNDLLRSALETAAINACGESRALALESVSLNVLNQASVRGTLPVSDQLTIVLRSGTAFFGFFNKVYIVVEMARSLNISGVDQAAAEYDSLVKKYLEVNARTNVKDPQEVDKAQNEILAAVGAFTPALTKLCATITTKMGNAN